MRVIACLSQDHNLWLVGLAALVCISGSWIAFGLYGRARERSGTERLGWIFLTAVAAGSSAWCTHFIAMLAYNVSAPVSFDPILTMASLVIAIAGCGLGFGLAANYGQVVSPAICGGILGLTIALKHYTGMAAYHVAGEIEWDETYVIASILLGATVSALALSPTVWRMRKGAHAAAVGLFVAGVVGLHFTGMAAVHVTPLAGIDGVYSSQGTYTALAVVVAGVGLMIVGTGVASYLIDERVSRDAHARLQAFIKHAPAAVAMFDKDMRYIAHTDRWIEDYMLPQPSLVGLSHYEVFPEIPEEWRERHARVLAGAVERSDEERFVRGDGTEQYIRWEDRPWYFADGTIGGMMMQTEEVSERRRIQNELWSLAKLDALTSLPNRLHFNQLLRDSLAAAAANGTTFAVALLDFDRLKEINDTLGHDAGDELIRQTASRLQGVMQNGSVIARLGGDEFACILIPQEGPDQIDDAAAAMRAAMEEAFCVSGVKRYCTLSMGISRFPEDAQSVEDLMKSADLALYRAKQLGRDRAVRFSQDMRASMGRRVELVANAKAALKQSEFELYFQPVVSVGSNLLSFEALLRWNHPVEGLMTPGQFEEIFEEPKLAYAIGDHVLDLALAQVSKWQSMGLEFSRVAVNVTSADFSFGCFADKLKKKLERHGVPAQRLCVEVTEKVFIGSSATHVADALRRLRDMGVEIALDDFGTGFASLSHIKAFPIHRLKIDRSFVDDMDTNTDSLSIVQAIVQLGLSMNLAVTAEGVENQAQLTLLKSMGCGSIQGYLMSKPLNASGATEILVSRPGHLSAA